MNTKKKNKKNEEINNYMKCQFKESKKRKPLKKTRQLKERERQRLIDSIRENGEYK